jgi:hypothetical protein
VRGVLSSAQHLRGQSTDVPLGTCVPAQTCCVLVCYGLMNILMTRLAVVEFGEWLCDQTLALAELEAGIWIIWLMSTAFLLIVFRCAGFIKMLFAPDWAFSTAPSSRSDATMIRIVNEEFELRWGRWWLHRYDAASSSNALMCGRRMGLEEANKAFVGLNPPTWTAWSIHRLSSWPETSATA